MTYEGSSVFSALAAQKPAVQLTLPPLWFFKFPPSPSPQTLPPPPNHPTLAHPFTIPLEIYNKLLDGRVPFTTALVYITTVTWLNSINASRKHKPWAFSKTRFFKSMVIAHNVILAVYSAWTCIGMVNALNISFYSPRDVFGLSGTVDSMCKISGPRGVGSAATYNEQTSAWGIANRFFHLGADGLTPEVTDVGRIWNEGLAFYGWLFYISKFYEVIDTLIIIAKGKKSSFLQTYHHAGAMVCMWAGIRYMSPPIWMFVLVNSFIHSIMYTFYFCSAIGIRLPMWFKRTLTTLQITQFVVGATYAFIHLFIKYQSPISVPYIYHLGDVATAVASDVSSVASTAAASASANVGAQLKKLALRAAGREGLAENVLNDHGQKFGIDAVKAVQNLVAREETRYRDELQWTHCLDTSGQAFAIYLNVLYLAPLTWLFIRFFIKSYLQRLERRRSSTTNTAAERANLAVESYKDAKRGAGRRLSQAFEDTQGGIDEVGDEVAVVDDEEFKEEIKDAVSKTKESAVSVAERSQTQFESTTHIATETVENVKEELKTTFSRTEEGMTDTLDDLKQKADLVKAQAESLFQAATSREEESNESTQTTSMSYEERSETRETTHERTDEDGDSRDGEESSRSMESGITSLRQSTGSIVDTVKDAVVNATESSWVDLKTEDTEDRGALQDDSSDAEQMNEDSAQQPITSSSDEVQGDEEPVAAETLEENTDRLTDSDAEDLEAKRSTDSVQDQSEKDDDQHASGLSSKEKVRDEDLDRETQAEASIGVPEKDETPANESNAEKVDSQNISSPEKPHKEDSSIEDSGDQEGPREDSAVEGSNTEKPVEQEPIADSEADKADDPTETHAEQNSHETSTPEAEENVEGRQNHFHEEREEALERLESIKSRGLDNKEEDNDTADSHLEESEHQDDQVASIEESGEEPPSFDEARAEALEKLKTANSKPQDESQPKLDETSPAPENDKENVPAEDDATGPTEEPKVAASHEEEKDNFGLFDDLEDKPDDKDATAPDSQDIDDQKESWIHIDDEEKTETSKSDEVPQPVEHETETDTSRPAEDQTMHSHHQQPVSEQPIVGEKVSTEDGSPEKQPEIEHSLPTQEGASPNEDHATSDEGEAKAEGDSASGERPKDESTTDLRDDSIEQTAENIASNTEHEEQAVSEAEPQNSTTADPEESPTAEEPEPKQSVDEEHIMEEASNKSDEQESQAKKEDEDLVESAVTNDSKESASEPVVEPSSDVVDSSESVDPVKAESAKEEEIKDEQPSQETSIQEKPKQDEPAKEDETTQDAPKKDDESIEEDDLTQGQSKKNEPEEEHKEEEPKQDELKLDGSDEAETETKNSQTEDKVVDESTADGGKDEPSHNSDVAKDESDQPTYAEVAADGVESPGAEPAKPNLTEGEHETKQASTEMSAAGTAELEKEKDEHNVDATTPSAQEASTTDTQPESEASAEIEKPNDESQESKVDSSEGDRLENEEHASPIDTDVSKESADATEEANVEVSQKTEAAADEAQDEEVGDSAESIDGEDSFVKVTADDVEEDEPAASKNADKTQSAEEHHKEDSGASRELGEEEKQEEDSAATDDTVNATVAKAETERPTTPKSENSLDVAESDKNDDQNSEKGNSLTAEESKTANSAEEVQHESSISDDKHSTTPDLPVQKKSAESVASEKEEQEPLKDKTAADDGTEQAGDGNVESPQWFEKLTTNIDSHQEVAPDEIDDHDEKVAESKTDKDPISHTSKDEKKDLDTDQTEAKKQDLTVTTQHEDPKEVTEAGA